MTFFSWLVCSAKVLVPKFIDWAWTGGKLIYAAPVIARTWPRSSPTCWWSGESLHHVCERPAGVVHQIKVVFHLQQNNQGRNNLENGLYHQREYIYWENWQKQNDKIIGWDLVSKLGSSVLKWSFCKLNEKGFHRKKFNLQVITNWKLTETK